MIASIKDISDVEVFIKQLVAEGTNAHPDEDFNNYVHIQTNEPTYTEEEAEQRNDLMDQSFHICEQNGMDLYDLMQEIFLKETGLNHHIPLPTTHL